MSDEVNGTVVNAASGGGEKMETPKELHFEGDELPASAGPIIQRVIDEFERRQRQPKEKSYMILTVLSPSKERSLTRLESLRSAIAKTGRLSSSQYSLGLRQDEERTINRLRKRFRR